LGKHYRATYQSQVNNRSTSAFKLVHSDVWNPNCVPSVKGFKYFLIFVDDLSRMTWLYLLKERYEVSDIIKLFLMINQFFTSIRVLRIDNALEYVKIMCLYFVLRMKLFIKLLTLTHPNKIVSLHANIDAF